VQQIPPVVPSQYISAYIIANPNSNRYVGLCDRLPKTTAGIPIADQLLRSATSAAPNYADARGAENARDFVQKLGIERAFAPSLEELKRMGYTVIMIYVWLQSPRLALRRVRLRASKGGHDVPTDIVIRRYGRGLEF
jgi:four helix bundle protein